MLLHWCGGRVVEPGDASLDALTDPARQPVCCTTARMRGAQPRHEAEHRARLARDAAILGAGQIDADALTVLWTQLSHAAFGEYETCEGIIRVEVHPGKDGDALLHGVPRALGTEVDHWRSVRCPTIHPGPGSHRGAKLVYVEAYERARAYSATCGVEETLLFDSAGNLVEGARSNIVVVDAAGRLRTPDPALGAVRGVGLSVLLEVLPELSLATITEDELLEAREIIAVNAVRGARPIVAYGESWLASGHPGDTAARLDALLTQAR